MLGRFNSNFGTSLRELVLAGEGVSILPEWSVRPYIASGQLVHCLPDYEVSHTDFSFDTGIYAVFVKGRYLAAKTRIFMDFLVDLFAETCGDGTGQPPFGLPRNIVHSTPD